MFIIKRKVILIFIKQENYKMIKGLVSVVVPNYNYGHFLSECIESVISQTYKNWELIVVDDNSTDNSMDVVQSYINKYPNLDIKLIHNKKGPSGTPTPINIGIKNMKGEYFAWLSSDDIFMSEKLEEQVEFLNLNKDVALVYCSYFKIDDNSFVYGEHFVSNYSRKEGVLKLFEKNFINGNTILVRKEVFETTGLYLTTHNLLPCFWYASEYLMHLEILMHYKIVGMRKKLHKARIHENNKAYNSSSICGELVTFSRIEFIEKYSFKKIIKNLNLSKTEQSKYFVKLWQILKKDDAEAVLISNDFNNDNIDLIKKYEKLNIVIKIYSSLVVNGKFDFAEEQLTIILRLENRKFLEYCRVTIESAGLKILNAAKSIYKEEIDFAIKLLIIIIEKEIFSQHLKKSAYFYLFLCYQQNYEERKQKEFLRKLLVLEPYHMTARKVLKGLQND